jgi:hypothetical protein
VHSFFNDTIYSCIRIAGKAREGKYGVFMLSKNPFVKNTAVFMLPRKLVGINTAEKEPVENRMLLRHLKNAPTGGRA